MFDVNLNPSFCLHAVSTFHTLQPAKACFHSQGSSPLVREPEGRIPSAHKICVISRAGCPQEFSIFLKVANLLKEKDSKDSIGAAAFRTKVTGLAGSAPAVCNGLLT